MLVWMCLHSEVTSNSNILCRNLKHQQIAFSTTLGKVLVLMWTQIVLAWFPFASCTVYIMVCRSQLGVLATLFLLFFFQLSLLKTPVSDAERLLLQEPPSSGNSANCKYWSTAVRSPRVIFCQVEPDDSQIKAVSSALPVVLDNNGHANPRVSNPLTNEREDYVILMDSKGENLLEECVSGALPSSLLNEHTALIICDRSTEFPRKLQKMESLKFLELASVLYLTATECWSASPFYLLKRRFSRVSNCYGTQWRYDWKHVPDMRGQALQVLITNSTFFTVIKENKFRPQRKTCILNNI